MKKLVKIILLILLVNINLISPALADDTINGTQIFSVHCAGCHINGSNIIRRGKNLKMKALKKNNMDSIEAIASIITNGKNNMSAYKERLTEQQIQDVATYVLEQAENNWR
ncbi:MAG: c-type cytochrome [Tolypothrix brevis GSE-NOS-MK-07-07A]|jgi:cytochrome c6|nr:c-type cytochrome [Tolypothrix brevis GSE-NOS-MK-07-07A]